MDRKKIILGLGTLTFIVGFLFISAASWFLNMAAGGDNTPTLEFLSVTGLWSLVGLALVAIGVIVILLIKFEK